MSKDKKVDALLVEYQACHMNRDHYDSVIWTIGSILIAASTVLLGISFQESVVRNFGDVMLLAIFSMSVFLIWVSYTLHVQPWVIDSLDRCFDIEKELAKLGFDIKLHTSIREKHKCKQIRGRWIFWSLVIIVLSGWFFRILLLFVK